MPVNVTPPRCISGRQPVQIGSNLLVRVARTLTLAASGVVLTLSGTAIANPTVPAIAQSSSPSRSSDYPAQDYPAQTDARFTCELENGQYTVMYHPPSQPDQSYAWAQPTELGGGWTEDRRCYEISRRLESYRPDGLVEMRTSVENGYDTVCVTTEAVPACRIILTVPPGQDPLATRDRVFSNLTVADSGQRTEAVTTFAEEDSNGLLGEIGDAVGIDLPGIFGTSGRSSRNSARTTQRSTSGIDLRPFLDPLDGGTGERL